MRVGYITAWTYARRFNNLHWSHLICIALVINHGQKIAERNLTYFESVEGFKGIQFNPATYRLYN